MQIFVMAFLMLMIAAPMSAQSIPPDLSGTWRLQADADAARNRRPITGLSIATELVIRQSEDELTVESNTGTGNTVVTTTYNLDGSEHDIPGPIGWDTHARSGWEDDVMVVNIRRIVHGPNGEIVFSIREAYTRVGETLVVERSQGRTVQKLVYERK